LHLDLLGCIYPNFGLSLVQLDSTSDFDVLPSMSDRIGDLETGIAGGILLRLKIFERQPTNFFGNAFVFS
jgi:hypothetical protein